MNPYRYDGRDGVRDDAADGLYWMSVRAYDPTVGRFLSHDPLGRAPLFFADQPYAYAGNNPVSNVDPSGQYRAAGFGSTVHESWKATNQHMKQVARMEQSWGCDAQCKAEWRKNAAEQAAAAKQALEIQQAKAIALKGENYFLGQGALTNPGSALPTGEPDSAQQLLEYFTEYFSGLVVGSIFGGTAVLWVGGVTSALIAYDLVSFGAAAIFYFESREGNSFWLNAQSMSNYRAWSMITLGVIIAFLFSVALSFVPELPAIMLGIAAGLAIGAVRVAMGINDYFAQEFQVFGYTEPN